MNTEPLVIIKWCHFTKEVQGRLNAEHYFPITEDNKYLLEFSDKDIMGEAELWAEEVNNNGNNSHYAYTSEFVDTPPAKWMQKKKEELEKSIEHNTKLLAALNKLIS